MNESTLESFINYCDEMQIAEEGFGLLSKQLNLIDKSSKLFKAKFGRAKSNEERLKLLVEFRRDVEDFTEALNSTDISIGDRMNDIVSKVAGVAGVITGILALIPTAGLSAIMSITSATLINKNDPVIVKRNLLNNLEEMLMELNKAINYISEEYRIPIPKINRRCGKFYTNKKSLREENKFLKKEIKYQKNKHSSDSYSGAIDKGNYYIDDILKKVELKEYDQACSIFEKASKEVLNKLSTIFMKYAYKFDSNIDDFDLYRNKISFPPKGFRSLITRTIELDADLIEKIQLYNPKDYDRIMYLIDDAIIDIEKKYNHILGKKHKITISEYNGKIDIELFVNENYI